MHPEAFRQMPMTVLVPQSQLNELFPVYRDFEVFMSKKKTLCFCMLFSRCDIFVVSWLVFII